ncbi:MULTISPECIES: hypothetical protein [Methanothrix]|uniref:hypothetical protein n=1 Tax=Methanothrix TaxID=2222 RepID=UPI002353EFC8|nr:hypothetical protein [Methanothrix sp.]HPL21492.1 hypothetical protein [Methanothrix soehngenii]HQN29639.1 hypothetical protein [Methanothrix soehngenii]HRD16735.1 hypothetical protein [Methanothrix soehngenii]
MVWPAIGGIGYPHGIRATIHSSRSMKKAMLVTLFCLPLLCNTTNMFGPVIAPDGAAADDIASFQTPFTAALDQLNPFGGNLHSVQAAN